MIVRSASSRWYILTRYGATRTNSTMPKKIPTIVALVSLPAIAAAQAGAKCDADNGGIKLPPGFCATVFADSVAGARQLVVAPNGDVIVSGRNGVTVLRDANGDGHADAR